MRGRDKKKVEWVWNNPEVLDEREVDGKTMRLVRLTDPKDLQQWGSSQRHCGGSWATMVEPGYWAFLTLLDENDVPHGTLHLKNKEYVDKHGEGVPMTSKGLLGAGPGGFNAYGNSPVPAFPDPVVLDDVTYLVIGAQCPGSYGDLGKYQPFVMPWYDGARVAGAEEVKEGEVA